MNTIIEPEVEIMQELVLNVNKAQVELDKHMSRLKAFCTNQYYALDWRFTTWELHVAKLDKEPYSLSEVPPCIEGFDSNGYPGGTVFDYEDYMGFVENNYYEWNNIDDPTEQQKANAYVCHAMIELKEWLMEQNIGTIRYD